LTLELNIWDDTDECSLDDRLDVKESQSQMVPTSHYDQYFRIATGFSVNILNFGYN